MKRHRRSWVVAGVMFASLVAGLGVATASSAAATPNSAVPADVASPHKTWDFAITNFSGYTLMLSSYSSKVAGEPPQYLTPQVATIHVADTDDPTDTGTLDYVILDAAGVQQGTVQLTLKENWAKGYSTTATYSDLSGPIISDMGISGGGILQFVAGGCDADYSGGVFSVDAAVYNNTPETMTLVDDTTYTSVMQGEWINPPPATLEPYTCTRITAKTDDPVLYVLATASYTSPSGEWTVFRASSSASTVDGGGPIWWGGIYTGQPTFAPGAFVGTDSPINYWFTTDESADWDPHYTLTAAAVPMASSQTSPPAMEEPPVESGDPVGATAPEAAVATEPTATGSDRAALANTGIAGYAALLTSAAGISVIMAGVLIWTTQRRRITTPEMGNRPRHSGCSGARPERPA